MSTKLERILWIDREIRAGRYPNARKVKEHFDLRSIRTAYEDRRFMIDRLGAPIGYDRIKGGWYYTEPSYSLPSLILTKSEITAFFLGEELVRRYLGTPFERPLRLALKRITRYLPEHISFDPQEMLSGIVLTGGSTVEVEAELLVDLHRAIEERRQVEIFYYTASRDELNERVVDPYHLHNIRGDWYLIAFCHKRKEVRDFLVSRIRRLKLLPYRFEMEPSFSLNEYLAKGFIAERGKEPVEVVIKFDAYQARWIRERRWHPSQEIEELPSGELILRLRVGGLEEVKRWVMGYGSHAEVLQPEDLRQRIREEIKKMKKIYG
ncbi:TPA: WYL domain-containing protein [Candidatus Poribacteria bacterium]|nr:WYL domain-containing protein [Candidatus Poribacteria bacterium]